MAQPATDPTTPTTDKAPEAAPDTPRKPADLDAQKPAPGRPADPPEEATEAATGLDMILVDAARGPLRRLVPPAGTALRLGTALARPPGTGAGRTGELARELGRITVGRSELAPGKKDKRFADPAWTGNPLLRWAMQAHLATARTAWELIEDADLDWQDDERIRFTATNLVDALAPSNLPVVNPLSLKAAIDTGGGSAVQGVKRLVRPPAGPPRVPTMVEPDAFTVGKDLAATPGAVVLRTPVFELIQYRPTTETVRTVPLLIVPPTINKFYVLDLAPGRSLVEHLVGQGQQVFMISWRNPDARHRDWGFDTYATAILDALDAVEEITGEDATHLMGTCSGGILASMTAAVLAAKGRQDRLASLSLLVTVLDQTRAGLLGATMDPDTAAQSVAASRRAGYLDGRKLAEVFAWLRPNDLIWNYWVKHYLQGKRPPKFDILSWNSDTTRMSARLHADFVDMT